MIVITHTHADGTLITGSAKGDGVYDVLRGLRDNWRYFPSIRQLGIGQSRDKAANTHRINRAAEALRAAGHEVTVSVDESQRRTVAEIEADRAERAGARAERYSERSERRGTEANAAYDRAHQMAGAIPFGQPILVGHHSEGSDRRYRDRIHNTFGRAFVGMREAEELGRRSSAAEANQSHRESIPATLRRITKLEADERGILRDIEGGTRGRHPYIYEAAPATGANLERLTVRLTDVREQLTYWREHVKAAEEAGVKVWSAADFQRGDYARQRGQWFEVVRVNAKSLSIPWSVNNACMPVVTRADARTTRPVPYDDIRGRKTAEEMVVILAEADRMEAGQ